jgi:hypothetical protein
MRIALACIVLSSVTFFVYASFRALGTYYRYYFADLSLDYQTRRRLVSTYAHLSEDQRNDPRLTDKEKRAFAYFPDLNKASKMLAISISCVIGAIAIAGLTSHFLER